MKSTWFHGLLGRKIYAPQPRVIGFGFPKTGTTTLGKCLEHLGYRVKEFDYEALQAYHCGNLETLRSIADPFDAYEDLPGV